eukprot:scaffold5975_cov99-Cylindrotheca_fusiformis.AAC.3
MSSSSDSTHWLPPATSSSSASDAASLHDIDALCLGTGRFLRSVLVPAMVNAGFCPALIQPRGRSFLDYMLTTQERSTYEVDTIEPSGDVSTIQVPCYGVFSLGRTSDKHALVECLPKMTRIRILGVGVTEHGLSSKDTSVMVDLYDLLHLFCTFFQDGIWTCKDDDDDGVESTIAVLSTDNVPNNGSLIQRYMNEHASGNEQMTQFLKDRIVFANTMLDRITSHRDNDPMVPSCEPAPEKALVILDPSNRFPPQIGQQKGVIVRTSKSEFDLDVALKLQLCNGTHTALAHLLALTKTVNTAMLQTADSGTIILRYLDALTKQQILPSFSADGSTRAAHDAFYEDWRRRLLHPHFGMSTFFITQNGPAKGGIRFSPTVASLLSSSDPSLRLSLAFAYAVLLRWLTPFNTTSKNGVFRGWFDGMDPKLVLEECKKFDTGTVVEYADGLAYNLDQGWYEFKCNLYDKDGRSLTDRLSACHSRQPAECEPAIWSYILHEEGGNLAPYFSTATESDVASLVAAVSVLYARLLAGDSVLSVLRELVEKDFGIGLDTKCSDFVSTASTFESDIGEPLHYKSQCIPDSSALMDLPISNDAIQAVVTAEVQSVIVVDLHTHLLPPSHGPLCLWGIDELLTYHYLVAEYFITAPADMTPEKFYSLSKQEQADIVWKSLFVDRLPISEACRGVITTLTSLGLKREVQSRDLKAIRIFYSTYRQDGMEGAKRFSEKVFDQAGVEYS